jgi:hypothetical protein
MDPRDRLRLLELLDRVRELLERVHTYVLEDRCRERILDLVREVRATQHLLLLDADFLDDP